MNIVQTYGKEIVAFMVPFIAWALNTFLRAKARLNVAAPHRFTFLVQEPLLDKDGKQLRPNQTVHTNSVVVYNSGREPATKLEIVFNWKPMCTNIWPSRHHEEIVEPDGRFVLIFPSLSPGESIGCEVLSVNSDLPDLIIVRSDQCAAQAVAMYPQPIVSLVKRRVAAILLALGLGTAVYLAVVLLQWLVLKTPAIS